MTEQEQRIAIAKACGFTRDSIRHTHFDLRGWDETVGADARIPDYTGNLNAMHEAEKVLDMHQQYEYGEALARTTIGKEFDDPDGFSPNGWGYYAPITATASQRAEAFLRTIGKWEESK